ncbi:hypothetical protein [Blautia sp. OF01-4LB]|uniref:hypothetical protein n=1 Tax=Blautia sp. OF01-4LB TaxID=2292286 RepID=UPI000E53351E|nr:hypothetical protein [Blautia sp. OF01-4LB]RHP80482.1 hypothetical protein DXA40_12195 [Blautia sp. OF01-4LB]
MTFRERLQKEHPRCINEDFGGCDGCPYEYGYEKKKEEICKVSDEECRKCWDRVIPGTEDKEMTRDDLKDGMICEQRDGSLMMWLNGVLIGEEQWCSGTGHDLKNIYGNKGLDIVKVYKTKAYKLSDILSQKCLILIWERKEPKIMTLADIERELGYPVKIVSAEEA